MSVLDVRQIFESEAFCKALHFPPRAEIEFSVLGAGEYNMNYLFRNPLSGEELVLRIPTGSQMHLNKQAQYEYEALKLLEPSGRTPKPVYLGESSITTYGFLVISYLPGKPLEYENDMEIAAGILADIHSMDVPEKNGLICPDSPLEAILRECVDMARIYLDYDKGNNETKTLIRELLEMSGGIIGQDVDCGRRSIINTELNSGNFLINRSFNGVFNESFKDSYLVDWEKPLFAYATQDLGHFLAPTTTFWKTDTILTKDDIFSFMNNYCKCSSTYKDPQRLWESVKPYFAMTCLRGITWCAMAWVEYENPGRPLKNPYTYEKIQTYISPEFLEMIRDKYIGV